MKALLVLLCLVTNNTDRDVVELYCTPAFSSIPGVDVLDGGEEGRATIPGGERKKVAFESPFSSPYWDVTAVDDAGNEYRFTGLSADNLAVTISQDDAEAGDTFDDLGDFDADDEW